MREIYVYCRTCGIEFRVTADHGIAICPHCRATYYSASESGKPTTEPIGTLTTHDRYGLLMRNSGTVNDGGYLSLLAPDGINPEDCLFRMLEPHEIAAGMSFPHDYKWSGTKRDRTKLAGNAVTPPAARDLMACVVESIVRYAA